MLIYSTWRLWFPDGGDGAFPVIPFFGWMTGFPLLLDWILSGALLTVLAADALEAFLLLRGAEVPSEMRWLCPAWRGIVITGIALILLDQQRLQPWMYHLLLLTPILALRPHDRGDEPDERNWLDWSPLSLVMLLTGSIYCWSAISKLDVSFAQEHGRVFVDAIVEVIGLSTRFWTPTEKTCAAFALPTAELLIGIAVLVPWTRRLGLFLSFGMHGMLILALGPWGMDQRLGVLLWNLMFIAQNILIVRRLKRRPALAPEIQSDSVVRDTPDDFEGSARWRTIVTAVILLASAAPILRLCGRFDNWPSWAVYAASNRRVIIRVISVSSIKLPWRVRRHLDKSAFRGRPWLRIDQWALTEFDAPIYPQDRFQIAVARALSRRYSMGLEVRVIEEANRFTGERQYQSFASGKGLGELADGFWLNTRERSR